jgi:hypothetical protein
MKKIKQHEIPTYFAKPHRTITKETTHDQNPFHLSKHKLMTLSMYTEFQISISFGSALKRSDTLMKRQTCELLHIDLHVLNSYWLILQQNDSYYIINIIQQLHSSLILVTMNFNHLTIHLKLRFNINQSHRPIRSSYTAVMYNLLMCMIL